MNQFDLSTISQTYYLQDFLQSLSSKKDFVQFSYYTKSLYSDHDVFQQTFGFSKIDLTFLLHTKINFLNQCLDKNFHISVHKSFDPFVDPLFKIVKEKDQTSSSDYLFVNKNNFHLYSEQIQQFIAASHIQQLFVPLKDLAFDPQFISTISNYFDFFENLSSKMFDSNQNIHPLKFKNTFNLPPSSITSYLDSPIFSSNSFYSLFTEHKLCFAFKVKEKIITYSNESIIDIIDNLRFYAVQNYLSSKNNYLATTVSSNEFIYLLTQFASSSQIYNFLEQNVSSMSLFNIEYFLTKLSQNDFKSVELLEQKVLEKILFNVEQYNKNSAFATDPFITTMNRSNILNVCQRQILKERKLSLQEAHETVDNGEYTSYKFSYQILNMFQATNNFYAFSIFNTNIEYESEFIKISSNNFHDSLNKMQITISIKNSLTEKEKHTAFLTIIDSISLSDAETLHDTDSTKEMLNHTFREIGLTFQLNQLNLDKSISVKRPKI